MLRCGHVNTRKIPALRKGGRCLLRAWAVVLDNNVDGRRKLKDRSLRRHKDAAFGGDLAAVYARLVPLFDWALVLHRSPTFIYSARQIMPSYRSACMWFLEVYVPAVAFVYDIC